jgi:hypothetical protein
MTGLTRRATVRVTSSIDYRTRKPFEETDTVSASFAIHLHCEVCGRGIGPELVDELPKRRDLERLREQAKDQGWAWLRPAGRDHYGDYCPEHAAEVRHKQARKGAKRQ